MFPQENIRAFCESQNLPSLNSTAKFLNKSGADSVHQQSKDVEMSKRQEKAFSLPTSPICFQNLESFLPFQPSSPSLPAQDSLSSNKTRMNDLLEQIRARDAQNQLNLMLSSMSNSNSMSDLVLHLRCRILTELFSQAFKRLLQSAKPDIARNLHNAVQRSHIKQPESLGPSRVRKIKRKNTDLMSSETIEESDSQQNRVHSILK